jgi:hypothetical protein
VREEKNDRRVSDKALRRGRAGDGDRGDEYGNGAVDGAVCESPGTVTVTVNVNVTVNVTIAATQGPLASSATCGACTSRCARTTPTPPSSPSPFHAQHSVPPFPSFPSFPSSLYTKLLRTLSAVGGGLVDEKGCSGDPAAPFYVRSFYAFAGESSHASHARLTLTGAHGQALHCTVTGDWRRTVVG